MPRSRGSFTSLTATSSNSRNEITVPTAPYAASGRLEPEVSCPCATLKNSRQGSAILKTRRLAFSLKLSSINPVRRSHMPRINISKLGTVTPNAKLQVSQNIRSFPAVQAKKNEVHFHVPHQIKIYFSGAATGVYAYAAGAEKACSFCLRTGFHLL